MGLTVHFLRDLKDPHSECWRLIPLVQDLVGAAAIARAAYADVRDYMGARGFRIMDRTGAVLVEETQP
jgi:hypothetical protein